MSLPADRERAHRAAATTVSIAIGVAGVTLAVFGVFLVVRGGLGFLFLALLLMGIGAVLAFVGFFFQLVPFRLEELAAGKREHDRREREAAGAGENGGPPKP